MFFNSTSQAGVSHSNAVRLINRLPGKSLTSIIALFFGLGTFGYAHSQVHAAPASPELAEIQEIKKKEAIKKKELGLGFDTVNLLGHQYENDIYCAEFSPDGQRIVSVSWDDTAKLWDLNGNLLHTLQGHQEGVLSAEFSPDGQMIITTSFDNTTKVWRIYN